MSKTAELWNAVADKMLAAIAAGTPPWECPWNSTGGLPVSGASGKPYRGCNVFILWAAMSFNGWSDNRFFSFKAAKAAADEGGGVRKGEKATVVFFNSKRVVLPAPGIKGKCWFSTTDPKLDKAFPAGLPDGTKTVWVETSFPVFNAAQIDGLPSIEVAEKPESVMDDDELFGPAKELARQCGGEVLTAFGGNRACYSPVLDRVNMPERESFVDAESLYATLFHEYSHASGHMNRLARESLGKSSFGSEKYAAEELVAESSAAFVMASLGLPYQSQHASYLANWARGLTRDEDAATVLKRAFQQGQRAADCVLAGLPSKEADQPRAKAA